MRPDQQQTCIPRPAQGGFTLVEMIMAIAITGILGGMVAMFIRGPVQGYVDSARRADMTDIADTAIHRITHDVRLALPNSVRVRNAAGGTACNGTEICYLEYLEMIAGGRYNIDASSCFNTASMVSGGVSCLTTVGDLVSGAAGSASGLLANGRGTIGASAVVVVNNQYNNSGNDCATLPMSSVYCGDGNATITGGLVTNGANHSEDEINFTSTLFSPSPNKRFQIVNTPVSYVCDPVAGTLTRYWGYAIQPVQPNNFAITVPHALLAIHISNCSFAITPVVEASAQSAVLVTMPLTITEQGEKLNLYGAAHVSSELGLYGAAHGNVP